MGTRHLGEMSGTFQSYSCMTEFRKNLEVATGPATKIQNRKRRLTLDPLEQSSDVLLDIVIAGALPKILGALVVMIYRQTGDFFQVLRIQFHLRIRRKPAALECYRRSHEIALADLDAAMAQDIVGGGGVEIEIRQTEV